MVRQWACRPNCTLGENGEKFLTEQGLATVVEVNAQADVSRERHARELEALGRQNEAQAGRNEAEWARLVRAKDSAVVVREVSQVVCGASQAVARHVRIAL
jgi:hypothetical protein